MLIGNVPNNQFWKIKYFTLSSPKHFTPQRCQVTSVLCIFPNIWNIYFIFIIELKFAMGSLQIYDYYYIWFGISVFSFSFFLSPVGWIKQFFIIPFPLSTNFFFFYILSLFCPEVIIEISACSLCSFRIWWMVCFPTMLCLGLWCF